MRSRFLIGSIASLALTAVAVIPAQAASSPVTSVDRAFVAAASESNATEIAFAKEAVENGNGATQGFARTMIRDHTKLQTSLAAAATPLGLKVYRTPSVKQGRTIARVLKLKGSAFDSAYRTSQVAAHRSTLVLLQKEVAHGSAPKLVAAARSAMPIVKMHLAMAEKLAKTMMNP